MLSRRKKQNAHTFLEGTSGSYLPRSVPPPIPICVCKWSTLIDYWLMWMIYSIIDWSFTANVSSRQNDPQRSSPSPSPTTTQPKKASIHSINSGLWQLWSTKPFINVDHWENWINSLIRVIFHDIHSDHIRNQLDPAIVLFIYYWLIHYLFRQDSFTINYVFML